MVVGTDSPPLDFETRPGELERMVARINESRLRCCWSGSAPDVRRSSSFGYRDRMPYVRTFLPLGGTIDYEAGTLERPKSWITNAGLEWLYRVVREPRQRWRRYLVHQPPVLYRLAQQASECTAIRLRARPVRNRCAAGLPRKRIVVPAGANHRKSK